MIVLDFETRSRCNLLLRGSSNYALDPSTDILCLVMHDDTDGQMIDIVPLAGYDERIPDEWVKRIENADYIAAHNAPFDRDIWWIGVEKYGFPEIPFNKWYCTSALCRVNAIPASLADACRAVGMPESKQKSIRGKALIKALSIPRKKDDTFCEDERLMDEMVRYCVQDVKATVDLVSHLRPMTAQEHHYWLINEAINERGVEVDTDLCAASQRYAEAEKAEINIHLKRLTGDTIDSVTQAKRILHYIIDLCAGCPDVLTLLKSDKSKSGISMDKAARTEILTRVASGSMDIHPVAYEIIKLVDAATATSVAKFKNMEARADDEDLRVRGAFLFSGASQTGRFSSKGIQLHNLPRAGFDKDPVKSTEIAVATKKKMIHGERLNDVMSTLSKLLRPTLVPKKGHVFVVGDWSAIEGRMLPWLADTPGAEKVLDIYRDDRDIYLETAEMIKIPDRQLGKVTTLSLGYQGAVGAFAAMAKNYGVTLPEVKVKRIVRTWRDANQWAVDFWADLQEATYKCVRRGQSRNFKPGELFQVGRVRYMFQPSMLGGTLIAILPGEHIIQYPFTRLKGTERKSDLTALKAGHRPKAGDKEWGRVSLYGGLLAENCTQANCAALMREKLSELHSANIPIVAHVHDEVISEVPFAKAEKIAEQMQTIMETPPAWADGLPLKCHPVILSRYGNH